MSIDNSKRVPASPTVCKIGLFFNAISTPSVSDALGRFFNVTLADAVEDELYVSSGSIQVKESSETTTQGTIYTQQVVFILPTTDAFRGERIDQFKRVKFLAIQLTNKSKFFFGDNDLYQNTPPKCKTSSDEKRTQITYTQKSTKSLGFIIQSNFAFQDGLQFVFQDGGAFNV
ncbi:hypothetical protein ACFFVB_18340 [Formosa undariae]|uniref:Uncharacterized protein n=1 Tax=Formosa undariae TaxID=1325436 RepID=A0ABV5F6H2_9FLAO